MSVILYDAGWLFVVVLCFVVPRAKLLCILDLHRNNKIIAALMLKHSACACVCMRVTINGRRRRCHFHHHRRHFTLLDKEKQTTKTSLLHKAKNFCTLPFRWCDIDINAAYAFSIRYVTTLSLPYAAAKKKLVAENTLYIFTGGHKIRKVRSKHIWLVLSFLFFLSINECMHEYEYGQRIAPVFEAPSQEHDTTMNKFATTQTESTNKLFVSLPILTNRIVLFANAVQLHT